MSYTITEKNNIVVLETNDLWNPDDNNNIIAELVNYIDNGNYNFVINLEKAPYINSLGLSFLISILTRARSAGGDVILSGVSENTQQLLLLTRLHSMFLISSTEEEAIEQFSLSKA